MFLSWQTLEGIQITIFLLMEVVEYLLEQGMSDFYNSRSQISKTGIIHLYNFI